MLGTNFRIVFYIIVCSLNISITRQEVFGLNSRSELQNKDINMELNNETLQDKTESPNVANSNAELDWITPETPLTTELVLSDLQTKQESEVETTVADTSQEDSEPELNDTIISTTEVNKSHTNNTSQAVTSQPENVEPKMDEEIMLSRKYCNLEINLDETPSIKIQIKIEPVYNKSSGICRVNVNGYKNSELGVLITNVNLYQNESEGEVLKVILNNMGLDYVLKVYNSQNDYYPLLLTETNRVYIALYYNIITSSKNYSYFNLEVVSYYKYSNHLQYGSSSDSYLDSLGERDADKIYFTTETSSFPYH